MDERIRNYERRAKAGDIDAAIAWMMEAVRTGDVQAQWDAMTLLGELQHPGLLKQLEEINDMLDRVERYIEQAPPLEGEIVLTDNSLGLSPTPPFAASNLGLGD